MGSVFKVSLNWAARVASGVDCCRPHLATRGGRCDDIGKSREPSPGPPAVIAESRRSGGQRRRCPSLAWILLAFAILNRRDATLGNRVESTALFHRL